MSLPFQPFNSTAEYQVFCISGINETTTLAGISNLVAFVIIFAVSCWAWRGITTGETKRLDYVLLPLYAALLKVICFVLVGRFAVWVFVSKSSVAFDFLNWLVLCPVFAALREGVAVFLSQNSAGYGALRRTALFMLAWALAQGTVGWLFWINSSVYDNVFGSGFWLWFNGSAVVLHVLVLMVKGCQRICLKTRAASRLGPLLYSLFLIVLLSCFFVVNLNVLPLVTYGCLWEVCILVYNFTWPLVAYLTLQADSQFWRRSGLANRDALRKLGMPLLDSEELDEAQVIHFAEVTLGDVIAVGGTATVYKAVLRGKNVAVKRFICDTLEPEQAFSYMREIGMLSRLRHPNIVTLHGVCVTPPFVSLVMEVSAKGSLFDLLTTERRLRRAARKLRLSGKSCRHIRAQYITPIRKLFLVRDVWAGLAFLHSQSPPILHGDIKSLNMLVDENWVLKMCDFGESRYDRLVSTARPTLARETRSATHLHSLPSSRRGLQSQQQGSGRGAVTLEHDKRIRVTSSGARVAVTSFQSVPPKSLPASGPPSSAGSTNLLQLRVSGREDRQANNTQYKYKQTPQWAAPEVFTKGRHTTASDVFSAGTVMYEICACQPPFFRVHPSRVPAMVVAGKRPRLPSQTPPALRDIILQCWNDEPSLRPTAQEVLDRIQSLVPAQLATEASGVPRAHARRGSSGRGLERSRGDAAVGVTKPRPARRSSGIHGASASGRPGPAGRRGRDASACGSLPLPLSPVSPSEASTALGITSLGHDDDTAVGASPGCSRAGLPSRRDSRVSRGSRTSSTRSSTRSLTMAPLRSTSRTSLAAAGVGGESLPRPTYVDAAAAAAATAVDIPVVPRSGTVEGPSPGRRAGGGTSPSGGP